VGLVSVVLEELLELLLVGLVEVVAVAVEVTVVVEVLAGVLLLLLVVDELELELRQSLAANLLTVVAPWPRFCTSVVLTVDGRAATWLENFLDAAEALPQWPSATACETDES
jgi:hypothetical protein